MTKNEILNLRAFLFEIEGKENELGALAELYEKFMKGEEKAWKDLEWKNAKKLEWYATRWELNDEEIKA